MKGPRGRREAIGPLQKNVSAAEFITWAMERSREINDALSIHLNDAFIEIWADGTLTAANRETRRIMERDRTGSFRAPFTIYEIEEALREAAQAQ